MSDALLDARAAYTRREWSQARTLFSSVWQRTRLEPDDLAALGDALWWLGRMTESIGVSEQAYHAYLDRGLHRRAATAAMEIGYCHFLRGQDAPGSGWMSRAARLLEDEPDCVERGFLSYILDVEAQLDAPELDHVISDARHVVELGVRHGEPSLVAIATAGHGRALVRRGQVREGLALLDEAMVAVLDGDLSPDWAGNAYCNVIAACHELVDLKRMWTWTESFQRWCADLAPAAVFTGICRVHRAQLMFMRGDCAASEAEAAQVCADLATISTATVAEAHYTIGEVRRIQGEFTVAERAYGQAHEHGRDPQPGFALLRLKQGRTRSAARSIEAALTAENGGPLARAPLCAAQVEIALSVSDLETARKAGDELTEIADHYVGPGLRAMADRARGALLLADGHPEEALPILRQSSQRWRELDAVYECAQVRLLLATAYDALNDAAGVARERDAAGAAFDRMGVAHGLRASVVADGLTRRELEVLALVAAGHTNREVAATLVLSPKTVARHLSNIFTKTGITSRTEAAAYAFRHDLVPTELAR